MSSNPASKRITASVVLYRQNEQAIRETLRGLIGSDRVVKIVLFDNSPQDELRAMEKLDARIRYMHCPENIGFGAGHNRAFAASKGESDFHIVLNPDVRFESSILGPIVEFMESNLEVGMLTPQVRYPNGELQMVCKRLPTPFDLFARRFLPGALQKLIEPRMRAYELSGRDWSRTLEAPCINGCFLFLRSTVLAAVGGYDEKFFMYLEDFDLERRIWRTHSVVYFPQVSIVHDFGRGSYRSAKLLKYHVQSALHYFGKWGWLRDAEREQINQRAVREFRAAGARAEADRPQASR